MNCQTCKHWNSYPLSHPQAERKGLCRALCAVPTGEGLELCPASPATLGYSHPLTGREYGCRYWEARHD